MTLTLPAVRPPTTDTEERLLDHSLTLFAEKGYEAASVQGIIEATGVTRPVLYYYRSSKEDLFKRLVHWKHDKAYRELGKNVSETKGCANRLRAIMRGSFAFCATDSRVPRLMFQTHFGPTIPGISEFMAEVAKLWFMIVHQVMQEGLDAGELEGGGRCLLVADLLPKPMTLPINSWKRPRRWNVRCRKGRNDWLRKCKKPTVGNTGRMLCEN